MNLHCIVLHDTKHTLAVIWRWPQRQWLWFPRAVFRKCKGKAIPGLYFLGNKHQYRGMIIVSLPSTKRLPFMKRLSHKPKFWISSQELIRGNTVTTLSKPCLDVMVILNWSLVAFLLGMQRGAYFGMQSVRDRFVPVSFETRHVCSGLLFLRWLMIIT